MFAILVNGAYFLRDNCHLVAVKTAMEMPVHGAATISIMVGGDVVTTIYRHR